MSGQSKLTKSAIRIINSGVYQDDEKDLKEFKRLLNGISLLGLPICLFYVVLFAIKGYPGLVALFAIGFPIFLFPILGNRKFGFPITRFFSTVVTPLYFLVITVLLGRESGFYLGFLVITVPPILFFKTLKAARPFVAFGVLCFALSFAGIGLFNPDKNLPFSMMIYIVNLVMVLTTQILMVTFFKNEISESKKQIEEKNQEITDSIKYAKRIQRAILPPDDFVAKLLPHSFVYYLPKDVVAGDFYWAYSLPKPNGWDQVEGDTVLIAAADCTGHGVPGAMVSVVCSGALDRTVQEFGITEPGKLLDKTRELVLQTFEASEEEVKDGMDIALCALSTNQAGKSTLKYAGANNPLWIVRNGSDLIEEIKALKQPIGKCDSPSPFPTHTIELNPGDSFYIFSDGYADQFGGNGDRPCGKKLKSGQFKKIILANQKYDMSEQKERIHDAFMAWKGELDQLDDICVIGVRV